MCAKPINNNNFKKNLIKIKLCFSIFKNINSKQHFFIKNSICKEISKKIIIK